jgi:allantoate deiminase
MGAERVSERLEELFTLGKPPHANRPGLSAAEDRAFARVAAWMEELDMRVERDPAANLVARRPGTDPDLGEVWVGSHLDTVPGGGRYDGTFGVVGALEAVEALGAQPLPRTVAVVAFRDEEGSRFGRSCFGSRALIGRLEPDELSATDASGISVRDALARSGGDPERVSSGWLDPRPACFLETHIEQGPVLERSGLPLGVVSAIVGVAELQVRISGRRGHAGTTPMDARADALVAAAELVDGVRALALSIPDAVATVGRLDAQPGAANVIAELAELSVDLRSPVESDLDELERGVRSLAGEVAERQGCVAEVRRGWRSPPTEMSPAVRDVLAKAVARAGYPIKTLPSGAGHDAAVMAAAGIPSAMLFVRSLSGGVSHSADEHSDRRDLRAAIQVLSVALSRLAA